MIMKRVRFAGQVSAAAQATTRRMPQQHMAIERCSLRYVHYQHIPKRHYYHGMSHAYVL